MTTVMMKILEGANEGKKVTVNFQTKSIKMNGKYLIDHGISEMELGVPDMEIEEFLRDMEDFYINVFKVSMPNTYSNKRGDGLFKAKTLYRPYMINFLTI